MHVSAELQWLLLVKQHKMLLKRVEDKGKKIIFVRRSLLMVELEGSVMTFDKKFLLQGPLTCFLQWFKTYIPTFIGG